MSDTAPLTGRLSSYHDFGGLASLRGDVAQGEEGAVRETAKQFEAYFIQQMLKTMREAMERSDLMENRDADTFQELMDKEIALKMADRGALGLADMLERNLAQRTQATGHEALSAREKAWPPQPLAPALPIKAGQGGLPLPERPGAPMPLKARRILKGAGDE